MALFEIGETIRCSIEIRDSAGTLTDPATSITITIFDPNGLEVVSAVGMTNDGVGLDHYDYTSAMTVLAGEYTVLYIATDGAVITKQKDTFVLEP